MAEWFVGLNPVMQALCATLFTWFVTALGASLVFFFKSINKIILNGMLGFAAGVMIAASFWSLLAPAIEMAEAAGTAPWFPAVVGFLAGGAFLLLVDKVMPHLHIGHEDNEAEGIKTSWRRSVLLVLAITLHNIPEGLAVGVAFGAIAAGLPSAELHGALALAIGIGLQNFPEGAAVSIPLRREGFSRMKSFLYGQASGIPEPVAGVLGAVAVITMKPLLPYALSFAAGAMIYVVIE
ncbi:MAG: ZIP family metal transporter, partial [Pseudomonadota bacterium]